jgi:hypothetical protein
MLTFPEMFVQVLKVIACIIWLIATIIGFLYVWDLYFDDDVTEKQKKYRLQLLIITVVSAILFITFFFYRLQFVKHG